MVQAAAVALTATLAVQVTAADFHRLKGSLVVMARLDLPLAAVVVQVLLVKPQLQYQSAVMVEMALLAAFQVQA